MTTQQAKRELEQLEEEIRILKSQGDKPSIDQMTRRNHLVIAAGRSKWSNKKRR